MLNMHQYAKKMPKICKKYAQYIQINILIICKKNSNK